MIALPKLFNVSLNNPSPEKKDIASVLLLNEMEILVPAIDSTTLILNTISSIFLIPNNNTEYVL
jgi:hypothetical protein